MATAIPEFGQLARYRRAEEVAHEHLAKFDDLDFNVFSKQDWVRLHESHTPDVLVHWPDGRDARGLERHIEDLGSLFVYAPNTRITLHPVCIAVADWTSVIGVMEGTFTQPMPIPEHAEPLPPTNKSFRISMCTVGHWKDGAMDEEWLFWDNFTYMKQLGVL